jgi:CheY-like chemotaxis protein
MAEAHSDGPGRGSEFVVRLPLLTQAPPAAVRAGAVAAHGPVTPLRILVVDDNADAAESLAVLLRLMGYEAQTATDGPAALAAAEAFHPDVVLLDIGLPGMSGYDVARRLKEAPWFGRGVLVAMTGYGSAGDRRRSEESGFARHLVKPVDVPTLQTLLAELAKR